MRQLRDMAVGSYLDRIDLQRCVLRLLIDGDADGIITWAVGALFIPSLALAVGAWRGSSKAFQAVLLGVVVHRADAGSDTTRLHGVGA